MLCEINDGILHNNILLSQFSSLCGYGSTSKFSLNDTTTTFHSFLRLFGHVRAKDIALRYNSASYKGRNEVALRAGLVAGMAGTKKQNTKSRKWIKTKKSHWFFKLQLTL